MLGSQTFRDQGAFFACCALAHHFSSCYSPVNHRRWLQVWQDAIDLSQSGGSGHCVFHYTTGLGFRNITNTSSKVAEVFVSRSAFVPSMFFTYQYNLESRSIYRYIAPARIQASLITAGEKANALWGAGKEKPDATGDLRFQDSQF